MSEAREDCLIRAKIAEQVDRYEDVVEDMNDIVKISEGDLLVEERNLLSVAYKNLIAAKRSSWRTLNSISLRDESSVGLIKTYLAIIEKEMSDICKNMCDLLDSYLIPKATTPESKVFYYKMSGDYYRYKAEFTVEGERKKAAEKSLVAYKAAKEASEGLECTSPICLGLNLNFSVFYYEILSNPTKACEMAKESFDAALKDLHNLPEETYKDSALIMQLLKDNIALWNSTRPDEEELTASPKGEEG